MHIFSYKLKLIITTIVLLFFIPITAYADGGERSSAAITLGWISISAGIVANLSLVIFKMIKKLPIIKLVGGYESTSNLTPFYKPVLDLHIMLNSVGFFAGMLHGFMLIRGLDYISFSLAIIMTFSMISGLVLRYASGRNFKLFGRFAHGQIILSVLLIVLVILHVYTMSGNFD
jgi:hypothetical protein